MPGTNRGKDTVQNSLIIYYFKIAHISFTNRTDDHVKAFFGITIEPNWEEN